MRAYLASGHRSSAEQVYDSHVKALDRLDLDEVPATTLDLRKKMTRSGEQRRDVVRAVLLEIGA